MNELWRLKRETYKGLLMRCVPGLHEKALAVLSQHVIPCSGVLDLAAGSGAWLARLGEAGFSDFTAVDLDVNQFRYKDASPRSIDLNTEFANEFHDRFSLVTAIEIIEHLECPYLFLRQIHSLLSDGGYLLLTTPNIGNWVGRLRFLVQGELRYFQKAHYDSQGHISPITDVHLRIMFEKTGLTLVEYASAGSFYGTLQKAVTAPVRLLFRLLGGRKTSGDVSIYLARKS